MGVRLRVEEVGPEGLFDVDLSLPPLLAPELRLGSSLLGCLPYCRLLLASLHSSFRIDTLPLPDRLMVQWLPLLNRCSAVTSPLLGDIMLLLGLHQLINVCLDFF